jgi:predicted RecA/RadA family phage recombinase
MTALTDNKEVSEKHRRLIENPVAASVVIFKGSIVMGNATGYLAPAAALLNATMAGIAYEKADNANGLAGDVNCKLLREGLFELAGAGFTQADIGKVVYASDDQTVSTTQGTNEVAVGKIAQVVSATSVFVDIEV